MDSIRYQQFQGIAASQGVAVGKAVVIRHELAFPKLENCHPDKEKQRYQEALKVSEAQIDRLIEAAGIKMGQENAKIFEAHQMILNDPELESGVVEKVEKQGINAEWALYQVAENYAAMFAAMEDPYLKERALDIKDISERMIRNMTGESTDLLGAIEAAGGRDIILVADDLTPSDTCLLDADKISGFVTRHGGAASHTAILARAIGIPAVVGVSEVMLQVQTGMTLGVDGDTGQIHIQPQNEVLKQLTNRRKAYQEEFHALNALKGQPSVTADGRHIELACNIAKPEDIKRVIEHDGEGVGLFRSEFLYMGRENAPSEEEQYEAYKQALEGMAGKRVIIRTLDVGGDKELPYLKIPKEDNPFLGYRAIRYCLENETLFKTQIRALLRAGVHGKLGIMFPMISGMEELQRSKAMIKKCEVELAMEGIPYARDYELGIMVEIPSAALQSDVLAHEVDFFSIGTNDLVQYTLAVDRMNQAVANLYSHYHPAVVKLIAMTIENGHKAGKWVGMCGEAAGDTAYLPLLIGLGLDEFSMSPSKVLASRKILADLDSEKCKEMAKIALLKSTPSAVKDCIQTLASF